MIENNVSLTNFCRVVDSCKHSQNRVVKYCSQIGFCVADARRRFPRHHLIEAVCSRSNRFRACHRQHVVDFGGGGPT